MKRLQLALVFVLTLSVDVTLAGSVVNDISAPPGYQRVTGATHSYLEFLRSIPLKANLKIKRWDGSYLGDDAYDTLAVLNMPLLFAQDLEQCADFAMRLWAEYLKSVDSLDELSLYDFNGRQRPYSGSQKTFREYLKWHMAYSNSYSVKLGAQSVSSLSELQAGDMIVQNDSQQGIGHVSVVIDEALNGAGEKVFLVGYSYMPAQEFHLEKAGEPYGDAGWFSAAGYIDYAEARFGAYGKPVIRRFKRAPLR